MLADAAIAVVSCSTVNGLVLAVADPAWLLMLRYVYKYGATNVPYQETAEEAEKQQPQ